MNLEKKTEPLNILDLFMKWRLFLYKFIGIGMLIFIIGVLFLPNEYITFSTVKGSGGSGFDIGKLMQSSGALSSLGSIADIAMPSSGGQVDYLVALLNTKSIQDSMINRFDLKKYYGVKKIEDAREELKLNTVVNKNFLAELLTVGVYHENPDTAVVMTDYYVSQLNEVYSRINEQSARNNRVHLENRYRETMAELAKYEDSLKYFQQKYGVFDIEAQTSAAIKATSELKLQILLKEVEAGVKRKMYGNTAEEVKIIQAELDQLNAKVGEMFDGEKNNTASTVFIPFKNTPELGLQYLRLYRNVKIYNELIKVIVPMLEQARLQEKRDSPSIVIVDKGARPEKKARPKRSIYVLFAFFGLTSLAVMYIFTQEHLRNIKAHDAERYERIAGMIDTFKNDFKRPFSKAK